MMSAEQSAKEKREVVQNHWDTYRLRMCQLMTWAPRMKLHPLLEVMENCWWLQSSTWGITRWCRGWEGCGVVTKREGQVTEWRNWPTCSFHEPIDSAPFWYVRTVMCELRLLYIMWTLYKLKYVLSTLGKLFRGVLGWALLYCWKLIPRVSISEHRNLGPPCLLLDSRLCRSSILGAQPYTNTNWFLHLKGCSSLGRF